MYAAAASRAIRPRRWKGRPGQTLEGLMAEAVIGLQDTLDERWKEANLLRYDQAASMLVDVPIEQLADWVEISRGMEGLTEIVGIDIASFARENVRAQIRYLGDQFRLEEALGRIGLGLSREGESWRLLRMGARRSPEEFGERDVEIVLSRSPINLANLVTVGRLLMVVPLVWLIVTENLLAAFWLFVAAGISDAVDGFIAKRFNARTNLGSYLDPLADKVLLDGIYVALAMGQWLPVWLVALVIGRDLLIVFGAALIRRRDAAFRPEPLLIGKLNTFAQMLLAACALANIGGLVDLTVAVDYLVIAVAFTTLLSGVGYVGQALGSARSEHTS